MNQERNPKPRKPQETSGRKTGTRRPDELQQTLNRPLEVSQLATQSGKGRKTKRTGIARREPENEELQAPRMGEIEEANKNSSKRMTPGREETDQKQPPIVFEQSTFQHKDRKKPGKVEPSLGFPAATFTGFKELPIGKAFLILLLWTPRLFVPWITAWHEFNVYILSNPWHFKDHQGEVTQHKINVFVGKSIIAVLCSVMVDLIRRKWEVDFYAYQILLVLFTLCPLVGGGVDVMLRAELRGDWRYKEYWFMGIVLMQWAMSVAFIMFPVQFSCIYSQHNKMSRNAHYSWTALFVMLEFINAYVAFLAIPAPCPTKEWTQIVVWAGIFLLMATVVMLTLIFLFAIKAFKYVMLVCCKGKRGFISGESDPGPFIDVPLNEKMKKLTWFSMMALAVVCSYFTFSVIERFVPYEDWNDHHFSSYLSAFNFCKILGVIFMAFVMFIARKKLKRRILRALKAEMIYLGLPHCLCVVALVILVGRFAMLSHPKEGDIIIGPVPNEDKAVLVFVNVMFRNWTICISSKYFPPVKIRPNQHVTREIYDIGEENFTVTMQVDPCFEPSINTTLQVENLKKGEWKIFKISLLGLNYTKLDVFDFYRTLYGFTIRDVEDLRPAVGAPQMLIFQWEFLDPVEKYYYEMNHSSFGSQHVPVNNSIADFGPIKNRLLWEVPATGTWTVRLWCYYYSESEAALAWVNNCSQCTSPLEFTVKNNSLYLIVEYNYEETADDIEFKYSWFDDPPPHLPQFPMSPAGYAIVTLGEVAGPNSDRLPSNEVLQKDWAIRISMALAGMAAGGIFLGFIYLFWVDPPIPQYRTISLAVCWALMGVAAEIPRIKNIEVGVTVAVVLLCLQIVMTASHFVGAYFMYTSAFNFRIRPD